MNVKIKDTNAHLFVNKLPRGAKIVGEISRRGCEPGALVLTDDWEFVQISGIVTYELNQREAYTAIIRAILSDFGLDHYDMAIKAGFSLDTIKSWSSGRRVPAFGTLRMLLLTFSIITL